MPRRDEPRVIVFIGFLGAFTTFSGFMLETAEPVRVITYRQHGDEGSR